MKQSNIERYLSKYHYVKKHDEYNLRCPICGDSKKDSTKKRLFISTKGLCKCFNCQFEGNFYQFVMEVEHISFREAKEKVDGTSVEALEETVKHELSIDASQLTELSITSDYKPKHIAGFRFKKIYPNSGGIYSKRIYKWLKNRYLVKPYIKYDYTFLSILSKPYEGWLGIPVWFKNKIVEIQYRNIHKKEFFTQKNEKNNFVIFNYENLDFTKPIIVFEGAFDALFMENSTCLFGASKSKEELLSYLDDKGAKLIFFGDNDVAGINLLKKVYNTYGNKYNGFIWDWRLMQYKDLNDIVKAKINLSYESVLEMSKPLDEAIAINEINTNLKYK